MRSRLWAALWREPRSKAINRRNSQARYSESHFYCRFAIASILLRHRRLAWSRVWGVAYANYEECWWVVLKWKCFAAWQVMKSKNIAEEFVIKNDSFACLLSARHIVLAHVNSTSKINVTWKSRFALAWQLFAYDGLYDTKQAPSVNYALTLLLKRCGGKSIRIKDDETCSPQCLWSISASQCDVPASTYA